MKSPCNPNGPNGIPGIPDLNLFGFDFGKPHTNGACDHEGQCVLLAIWGDVGDQMQRALGAYTLAELSGITTGDRPWPGS